MNMTQNQGQRRTRRWLHALVSWWRRITGRDRYYMAIDPAVNGGDLWVKSVVDTKTGIITVLEFGTTKPPANEKLTHPAGGERGNPNQ